MDLAGQREVSWHMSAEVDRLTDEQDRPSRAKVGFQRIGKSFLAVGKNWYWRYVNGSSYRDMFIQYWVAVRNWSLHHIIMYNISRL